MRLDIAALVVIVVLTVVGIVLALRARKLQTPPKAEKPSKSNPYHIQFVDEKPGTDHHGNAITWVRLRCAKTQKLWTEMDYGRNRYNTCLERSCDGCGIRIYGEDFEQDQWGKSRDEVRKACGMSDASDGLTREAIESLKAGKCPDCGSREFYGGPTAGMCENVTCAGPECGSRFNLGLPMFAQRISEPMPLKKVKETA